MLFTLLFPTRGVHDYTSGYRAYRDSVIRAAFAEYGDDFVGETGFSCMADVLLKLRKQGALFGEAPLRLRYDQKGGDSKMRVFRTIWLTLLLLGRHRVGAKSASIQSSARRPTAAVATDSTLSCPAPPVSRWLVVGGGVMGLKIHNLAGATASR